MDSVISKSEKLPVESLLLEVADVLATSLDLETTVSACRRSRPQGHRLRNFRDLFLYEKTQELRFRFQIGYPPDFAERRIKVGEGVTGLAAQFRQAF